MTSETREVRLRQQQRVEKELEARRAVLAARGLEARAVDRDPAVRKLRAQLSQGRKRLEAIDAKEALVGTLAERKAAKAAAPKEPKAKAEKKVEPAPAPGEGKKKKDKAAKAKEKK